MYVSKPRVLSSIMPLGHNAPHPTSWPLGDPQKVIHIDTILILVYIHTYIHTYITYIHTYILHARRINIALLMRATPFRNPQACIQRVLICERVVELNLHGLISGSI